MQGLSEEARKCAQDHWAEKVTEDEAISRLHNIRDAMTDYHTKWADPKAGLSWNRRTF